MIYFIDASSLIDACELYYQPKRVPEYWTWLTHHVDQGSVKMPIEIYNEVTVKNKKTQLYQTGQKQIGSSSNTNRIISNTFAMY